MQRSKRGFEKKRAEVDLNIYFQTQLLYYQQSEQVNSKFPLFTILKAYFAAAATGTERKCCSSRSRYCTAKSRRRRTLCFTKSTIFTLSSLPLSNLVSKPGDMLKTAILPENLSQQLQQQQFQQQQQHIQQHMQQQQQLLQQQMMKKEMVAGYYPMMPNFRNFLIFLLVMQFLIPL